MCITKSMKLVKFRLWFYSVAFVHLACIACLLLTKDFTTADDPKVWIYQKRRWKLITSWFNLVCLVYYPISVYCNWRELRKEEQWTHIKLLNYARSICFSSIILPTTLFADMLFWRLWYKDRTLLAPTTVDQIIPYWTQHSMHTISIFVVLLDLVLTPREKWLKVGIAVMCAFTGSYIVVCLNGILREDYIYPFLEIFSLRKYIALFWFVIIEHLFYYTSQWVISEMIWGDRSKRKNK